MDQIRITDEMKQRILQNVKDEMEEEDVTKVLHVQIHPKGRDQKRFLSYGRFSRYISAAACLLMVIWGGVTLSQLHKFTSQDPSVEITLGIEGDHDRETMAAGSAEAGSETGEGSALAINGLEEVNSLEELSQALGFLVPEIKNIPFEVKNTVYTNGWNEFAQIVYQGEHDEIMFRKARGADDISGDFNTYEDEKTVAIKDASVTLKGENGNYSLAAWQQDGFTYSLSLKPGGSEAVFTEMIQSIQ